MNPNPNKSTGFTHEKIETNNFLMIVLILLVVAIGGLVEIVPLFFQKSTTEAVQGVKPLHAAAAGRPRRLPARGLLQLPLADDPALPRGDAALRPLLGGRRVRLRPSVPVGQQAHRPRPAPRGRQVQRRVAPHPPEQPARPGARVEHAGLFVAGEDARRCRGHPTHMRALRRVGVPYTDEEIAGATEAVKGKTEMDATVAYLQSLGLALK
jgi:cytochrome c oxidase cbb3-type subunit 2